MEENIDGVSGWVICYSTEADPTLRALHGGHQATAYASRRAEMRTWIQGTRVDHEKGPATGRSNQGFARVCQACHRSSFRTAANEASPRSARTGQRSVHRGIGARLGSGLDCTS